MPKHKNIYTIAASQPFLEVLANDLFTEYKDDLQELSKVVLILPTRRACRSFQEIILSISGGIPLILPKLFPISDIDPYDLSFNLTDFHIHDLPDAIPAVKRQLYLVHLIQRTYPEMSYEQSFGLSSALAQLLDQIHTEDLDLKNLKDIVDEADFSSHWQITLDFLGIISEAWPLILQEEKLSDPAEYRNKFIQKISRYWNDNKPEYPVIFAGSTGTIPAVREFMRVILNLPNGKIILPGLDKIMPDEQWQNIKEGYPQAALKELLAYLNLNRRDIPVFSHQSYPINDNREFLASALHYPTDSYNPDTKALKKELSHITLYECDTLQEEAMTVSLILRETLETENKIAAFITPNRKLAKHVQQICKRWNINIDDTAGEDLSQTEIGKFLNAIAKFSASDFNPVDLLALLKSGLVRDKNIKDNLSTFEILLLRGIKNYKDFNDLQHKYTQIEPHLIEKYDPKHKIPEFIERIKNILQPVIPDYTNSKNQLSTVLKNHVKVAEELSSGTIWEKENAPEAVELIGYIDQYSDNFPDITYYEYYDIFTSLLKTITTRPKYGTNERVKIYGLLEARMIQSDIVIMGGLNEGMWPADAGHDPWMSRPMRQQYGLPSPERGITLSAHDFTMGFCQKDIYLTRAKREDGTPTVPSRWIQKFSVLLESLELSLKDLKQGPHLGYSRMIDFVDDVKPITRPEPRPPANARPRTLSVTKIDTWRNDPYGLYANKILNLYALNPIKSNVDAADRGIILHEILQVFNETYKKALPDQAETKFLEIAKQIIIEKYKSENLWLSWKSRLIQIAETYSAHEKEWRANARLQQSEDKISCNVHHDFMLEARVDRIDLLNNSDVAIIDYKSGGQFSSSKILNGSLSQLPLEAYIMAENSKNTGYIGYWKITGGTKAMEETALNNKDGIMQAIETVSNGLKNLITVFSDENTPYYALPNPYTIPPYNDYAHLERVAEWAALDEEEAA